MTAKTYVVALRSDRIGKVSPHWPGQLAGIAGVEVHDSNPDQARIRADDHGIRQVRAAFNADFLIEEEVPRSP